MKNVLHNKKGISLIEILVGSLMFALIAITVTAVIAPMMMAYVRANNLAEYNTLLDSVGNQIVSDLARSTSAPVQMGADVVEITINTDRNIVYTVENGSLIRNGSPVFADGFYKGKSINFLVEEDKSGYAVVVTVESGGETGMAIERTYTIRPLMLMSS